jgi:hypothetical protein
MCNARPKGTPTQVAEISGGSGQDAKAQRSVLGRFGSREGYITDSLIRSQVGRLVSRAAVRQGIQLRRLQSVRPVASAWVTRIFAMNSCRLTGSIVTKTCNSHLGVKHERNVQLCHAR